MTPNNSSNTAPYIHTIPLAFWRYKSGRHVTELLWTAVGHKAKSIIVALINVGTVPSFTCGVAFIISAVPGSFWNTSGYCSMINWIRTRLDVILSIWHYTLRIKSEELEYTCSPESGGVLTSPSATRIGKLAVWPLRAFSSLFVLWRRTQEYTPAIWWQAVSDIKNIDQRYWDTLKCICKIGETDNLISLVATYGKHGWLYTRAFTRTFSGFISTFLTCVILKSTSETRFPRFLPSPFDQFGSLNHLNGFHGCHYCLDDHHSFDTN